MVSKAKTKAVANWDEELAKQADTSVQQESTAGSGGGRFFGMRAGVLTYADATFPGNQIAVVIVDHIFENLYYKSSFDSEAINPPTCFAFGRDATTMGPPEEVDKHDEFERQADVCADCWANEWASAEKGKGKACGNRRRLALIPAGTYVPQGRSGGFELELEEDEAHFNSADVAYMKLPVTSAKGFQSYVKQVAEQFKRPLHGVVTRIYLEPHPKYQFQVKFEMVELVPNELMGAVMGRHNTTMDEIDFPYIPRSDDDEPEAKTQRTAKSSAKLRKSKEPAKSVRRK